MSNNIEKLTRSLWSNSIFENDLPVGIYAISKDGGLAICNSQVRQILKLPSEDLNHSLTEFLSNQQLVDQINQKTLEAERQSGWVEKHKLSLKVEGHEVFVHHYMRAIKDGPTGEVLGYLCCIVDFTAEERYRQIFESAPVGVYQLDRNDYLTEVNPAVVKMLGYESAAEIVKRPVREFYLHQEDAEGFRQLVEGQLSIVPQRVELLRKDGEIVVASVVARRLTSPDGEYVGREGAMMDVTNEERYRMLLEEMPVGLYEVRTNDQGEDIIKHCNQQFVSMNQFDDVSQVIGFKVRDFYPSREEYEKLKDAIRQKTQENKPLLGYWVPARSQMGREMVVEVNTRVLNDRNGKMIGRVGAVRDVTEESDLKAKEEELSKKVEELTYDIGNVLHSYSTSLVNVQQSTHVVLRSLGDDPFEKTRGILPEQMVDSLATPAKRFAEALGRLLQASELQHRSEALPEDRKKALTKHLHLLRNYERIIEYPMARLSTLRESAITVLSICNEIQKGSVARDLFRQIRMDGRELVRLCNLITLRQVSDLTLEMDHVVHQLRGYVFSGRRERVSRTSCLVKDLISQTGASLYEFARSRGIDFRVRHDDPECKVEIAQPDVIRALSNLLHNAIKYSWNRPGGASSWITIHTYVVERLVHIEFENYGVPIPREEIAQRLIFRIGFRGRKSSDRRRTGTGIGLADALQVAKEQGGTVAIESHPASQGGRPDNYNQPFLTTVTFKLPVHTGQGEKLSK